MNKTFTDGTMEVAVDGKIERRPYAFERVGGRMMGATPDLKDGEHLIRYVDGHCEIITVRSQR